MKLVKRLLGEGCQVRIWDPDVSFGAVVGSNRQFIKEVIPHIGSLLSESFESVVETAEVVVVGTKSVDKATLARCLRPEQVVVDLVNLSKSRRPDAAPFYEGICW